MYALVSKLSGRDNHLPRLNHFPRLRLVIPVRYGYLLKNALKNFLKWRYPYGYLSKTPEMLHIRLLTCCRHPDGIGRHSTGYPGTRTWYWYRVPVPGTQVPGYQYRLPGTGTIFYSTCTSAVRTTDFRGRRARELRPPVRCGEGELSAPLAEKRSNGRRLARGPRQGLQRPRPPLAAPAAGLWRGAFRGGTRPAGEEGEEPRTSSPQGQPANCPPPPFPAPLGEPRPLVCLGSKHSLSPALLRVGFPRRSPRSWLLPGSLLRLLCLGWELSD